MEMDDEYTLTDRINHIYIMKGFNGVIEEIEDRLEYGTVQIINGLYRITTGGWSDDEALLHTLMYPTCKFSRHYKGYIVGGAFYFSKEKYAAVEMMKLKQSGD